MLNFILRASFSNFQTNNNIKLNVAHKNDANKYKLGAFEDDVVSLAYCGSDKNLCIKKNPNEKYFVYSFIFEEDKSDLTKKLNMHSDNGLTDSELMLELYLKYGKDGFKILSSGFIFILIDYAKEQVIAFRDHIGIKNICYYYDNNGSIYLSSSFKNIYALDHFDFNLNLKKIKNFLEFKDYSNTNTFINEINKVPPSCFIKYYKKSIKVSRYFKYDLNNNYRAPEEQIQGLADLLKKSILIDKTKYYTSIGFLLSGGIDSSTVISFFKKFNDTNHKIFSFSAHYKKIKKEVLHLIDESEYQSEINKSGNINDITFNGEEESTLSKIDFYLDVIGQPFFFPNLYIPNKAFSLASDRNICIMVNGNDGDTVISHGYEYLQELFFSFRWIKLAKEINLTSNLRKQSRKFIFKRIIYDNISYKNFLNSSARKKHLSAISSSNHSKAIEIQSLVASYYGIEERYPFYNKELIQYCLNISPNLKNKNGHSRYALKEAIKDIVPEKIRNRTRKSNLGHALCLSFAKKDREFINEQLSKPNDIIKNIININDLRKSWDDLKKNPRKYTTASSVPSKIFSYVVLNRWLENIKKN